MTHPLFPAPNPVPSYWLRDPSPLADLRSTPHLPPACDIAVVGAGLAGVLSAYHILTKLDALDAGRSSAGGGADVEHGAQNVGVGAGKEKKRPRVVLLDARQLCSGATGRNGGHVKVQVRTLLDLPRSTAAAAAAAAAAADVEDVDMGERRTALQAYVHRVIAELKRVVDAEAIECEFELRRSFDVFVDAAEAQDTYARFDAARKSGEQWTSNVTWYGPETAERVTSVRGAKGAFSVPAASFWPYKFVAGLLGVMHARWGEGEGEGGKGGALLNVQMGTLVTSLSSPPSSASSTPSPSSTTTQHTLLTPRGPLTATKLLLATNAYTAGLLPVFRPLIRPVRGMASHHSPSPSPSPNPASALPRPAHLLNTYNISHGPGQGVDYLNPRPDGGIVAGGGAHLFRGCLPSWDNNADDASLFAAQLGAPAYWDGYMARVFVGWDGATSSSIVACDALWTGVMGRTPDGMPFVGRAPGERAVWVLAGFNGGGMAVIAVAARAVGGMVVENKGFEGVWEGEGLLRGMGCWEGRLAGGG
ncbi:hypothetical protein G6514_005242 [Epicoccum nigrum]|nr:hypothetical protein G6514_005242 [Epicoccum nigrum]